MRYWEVGPGVYEIETDLGTPTWQEALGEAQSCDLYNVDNNGGMPDLGAQEIMVAGPACQRVVNYFTSDVWYEEIARLCRQDEQWVLNWAWPSVRWFRQHTKLDYMWHRAPPDYSRHEYHADALRMVVHGLMYLSPINDDRATTLFRFDSQQHAITTGFDRGWTILQNGCQMHRGVNHAESPRYVFKWMYTLKFE